MKRVSIVGLGYIGLPTAILAAQSGFDVQGFDVDIEKVKRINFGIPTILEPELGTRLLNVLKTKNLRANVELQYADIFVVTVPTPITEEKTADLGYVFSAGESIAKVLMPGNLVILESTVPVGTTEKFAALLEQISGLTVGEEFFVSYCPERVLPGNIFKELVENDRVVGGMCSTASELTRSFYSKFVKGFLHLTDSKTAEMVKLIENSSRDVQIAFANQVASMCESAGLDPFHVIELANKHPRVKILNPGCGVGGHCIAVDPWFLIESFSKESLLLQNARAINDAKPYKVIDDVLEKIDVLKSFGYEQPKVLALGLTFKADVDDIRESPALKIVKELYNQSVDFDLLAFDPNLTDDQLGQLSLPFASSLHEGLIWADIVVVLVKHKYFYTITDEQLKDKHLVDACGIMHDMHKKQNSMMLKGATKPRCEVESVAL